MRLLRTPFGKLDSQVQFQSFGPLRSIPLCEQKIFEATFPFRLAFMWCKSYVWACAMRWLGGCHLI